MNQFDIIIIGSGLAGYTLVKQLRMIDKTSTIAMFSDDDASFYSKPLLSTGFSKNKTAQQLASKSAAEMKADLNIEIFAHSRVQQLDRSQQQISAITADADHSVQQFHYRQSLVFATGAQPIDLQLDDSVQSRCLPINDLADYQGFRDKIEQYGQRIAIVGSGLVGTEYANDLIASGHQVSVISLDDTALQQLLPQPLGNTVAEQLAEQGVQWHFNNKIESASLDSEQNIQLTLSDGSQLECDLILSAIGLKPADQLAQQAELSVNRGICVDQYCQTNDANIYAIGDCARINGINLMYVAVLTLAAKVLAKTLTGNKTPLSMPASPVIVKTPSCPVVANPPPLNSEGEWQIEGEGCDLKACFYQQQQLVGFALTGKKVMERMKLAKQLPVLLP